MTIASQNGKKTTPGPPKTTSQTFTLAGRSVLSGDAIATRQTPPLRAALESWGGGTATVTVPKLASYPRLVVTVLAGSKVVAHGGLRPKAGVNVVTARELLRLRPKGTRLRVTVGASSPAGQIAYLGFAGSGSATIGTITLRLSTLAKPISG